MPLKNRYLKYSPEITLEIFTLVWNKLIKLYRPSYPDNIETRFEEFKSGQYVHLNGENVGIYESVYDSMYETTVQEILGYNPFVKEDFVLPVKWYILVNDKNIEKIEAFKRKSNWTDKAAKYKAVGFEGVGYNDLPKDYTEITFEQFKKYVLKESIQDTEAVKERNWSIVSDKELLEEAKLRYPIGTKYDCKYSGCIQIVGSEFNLYYDHNLSRYITDGCGGQVFQKNQWAKIISLPETKVESKEVVPEYVECIKQIHTNEHPYVGQIIKAAKDGYLIGICSYKSQTYNECFKPSTEAAYLAQNQPKPIEKWSVGTYAVAIKGAFGVYDDNEFPLTIGDIFIVKGINYFNKVTVKESSYWINSENLKWFATRVEAEEFSKTLIEPVKEEVKHPLKQAVHCKDEDEWNFVKDKICRKDHPVCKISFRKNCCLTYNNSYDSIEYLEGEDYQILSFQEWCDLNGYKMESNQEFKVGDLVMINESELPVTENWLGEGSRIKKQGVFKINETQDNRVVRLLDDIKCCLSFSRFRHATPEEINNYLISIGQIPAGEPLNTGIEPNKDGMFKYTTKIGTSWSGCTIENHIKALIPTTGNCYDEDFSTSLIPIEPISAIEFNYLPEPK